jgi:hypothetical protein
MNQHTKTQFSIYLYLSITPRPSWSPEKLRQASRSSSPAQCSAGASRVTRRWRRLRLRASRPLCAPQRPAAKPRPTRSTHRSPPLTRSSLTLLSTRSCGRRAPKRTYAPTRAHLSADTSGTCPPPQKSRAGAATAREACVVACRISSLEAVAGPHVHIRAPGVRMPCAHAPCSPHALCSQRNSLVLIPSENYTSKSVLDALGSVMSNKYSVRSTRYFMRPQATTCTCCVGRITRRLPLPVAHVPLPTTPRRRATPTLATTAATSSSTRPRSSAGPGM